MARRTIKSTVFEVIPDALAEYRAEQAEHDNPDGIIRARRLYYKVRRRYLNHPERPRHKEKKNPNTGELGGITYHYFETNLLPAYQRDHEIENLEHDPRGHIYEPHVGRRTELGTGMVKDFVVPDYFYNKVLYIEKEGQMDDLLPDRLAERFDMVLCGGKGYATEASRDLLTIFGESHGFDLYVVHDADPFGFNIAACLEEATERMPDHSLRVYDLGLTIEQGWRLGGQLEPFPRKEALPQRILSRLTNEELRLFTGVPIGDGNAYECLRIELDSIPISDLIALIEAGVLATGAVQKVIPPEEYLNETARITRDSDVEVETDLAIDSLIDRSAIQRGVIRRIAERYDIDGLAGKISAAHAQDPHVSWRQVVTRLISEQGRVLRDEITAATREELANWTSSLGEDEEDSRF